MSHAALACVVALGLAATSCAVPTLAQRQDAWRTHVKVQKLTCASGFADPAMPGDVREWCARAVEP